VGLFGIAHTACVWWTVCSIF